MVSQQLQAASTLGLLQMGQIICHVQYVYFPSRM
jgi:hypothetical protein